VVILSKFHKIFIFLQCVELICVIQKGSKYFDQSTNEVKYILIRDMSISQITLFDEIIVYIYIYIHKPVYTNLYIQPVYTNLSYQIYKMLPLVLC
jgi:hypothetical protein